MSTMSVEVRVIRVPLPAPLIEALGTSRSVAARLRELAVLDLLRRGDISQGYAVELLGVSYPQLWELMAEHHMTLPVPEEATLRDDLTALQVERQDDHPLA